MRDSQSLLDQVISFAGNSITTTQVSEALGLVDRSFLYQMLTGLVTPNPVDCLDAIQKVYAAGYDLTEFSSEMLEVLRNATLVVLSPDSGRFVDIPEDEIEQLRTIAKQSTADVFTRAFQVMLEVHEQVSRSPRPKLALEMAVARLVSIRPARSIDSLLEKISQMQAGIPVEKKNDPATIASANSLDPKTKSSGFLPSSTKKAAPQSPTPAPKEASKKIRFLTTFCFITDFCEERSILCKKNRRKSKCRTCSFDQEPKNLHEIHYIHQYEWWNRTSVLRKYCCSLN